MVQLKSSSSNYESKGPKNISQTMTVALNRNLLFYNSTMNQYIQD